MATIVPSVDDYESLTPTFAPTAWPTNGSIWQYWYDDLYVDYKELKHSQMSMGIIFIAFTMFAFCVLMVCVKNKRGEGGIYYSNVSEEEGGIPLSEFNIDDIDGLSHVRRPAEPPSNPRV